MADHQRQLIERVVSSRRPELLELLAQGRPLTDSEREELRGVVADELMSSGLQEDDTPNRYGLQLEGLIDWLGHQ